MATYVLFVMWASCCALVGWLAKYRGRETKFWVALAVMLSFVSLLLFEVFNQPQWGSTASGGDGWVYPSSLSPGAVAFLPPLLALAVIALLPNRNRKRCPDCGETIQAGATLCRYCRHAFDQAARLPANT